MSRRDLYWRVLDLMDDGEHRTRDEIAAALGSPRGATGSTVAQLVTARELRPCTALRVGEKTEFYRPQGGEQ